MRQYKGYFFLIVLICFSNLIVLGQVVSEKMLVEKTSWKNAKLPANMLYITTDKILYLPTEVIWFTSYLLPYVQKKDTVVADMLSVALVSDKGDVVLRKTYAIDNLTWAGSLTLTDSIAPGNYQFIACTNLVNNKNQPVQQFVTPIIIRSASVANSFFTQFDLQEQKNADTLFISASLKSAEGVLVMSKKDNKKNGLIRYGLTGKPNRIAYFDKYGLARLAIPRSELAGSVGVLQTATTFEGKTKHLSLHSPIFTTASINLNFYPEGGDLVEDLACQVAYTASFADGKPTMLKLQLIDNGVVKDTLRTDSLGIGIFSIVPKKNHVYSLRLMSSTGQATQRSLNCPKYWQKAWC